MEFELQRFTRRCAATQRELQSGETYYSVLISNGADVARRDYAEESWPGPPADALGWWKSVVPHSDSVRMHWAPRDVMLHLFGQLADQPEQTDFRYLLTLLMIRRRILKLVRTEQQDGQEYFVVSSPRLTEDERILVSHPDADRKAAIQDQLQQLIFERAA